MRQKKFHFRLKPAELMLIIFLFVSSVSLAFHSGGFIISFSRIGFSIISTVERAVFFVTESAGNVVSTVKQFSTLKKDYAELIKKLEQYERLQRANVEITKENKMLREQLGFVNTLESENFFAQIISRDLDTTFPSLVINKGSANGIMRNMSVIAYQHNSVGLVGKVVEVGKYTSKIMPVYSLQCSVSSRLQTTRDIGIVSGSGSVSLPLVLNFIRKRVRDQINIGDTIVTSGENENYTRDIPIGTISEIRVIDYDSSLEIEITPTIDFARLESVIVISNKKGAEEL